MGLFTTKSFCFCLSVKTGGLALGFFVVLGSILNTVIWNYKYTGHYRLVEALLQRPEYRNEYNPNYASRDHIYFALLMVFLQIILFVSIAWLYGIFRKKASWMLAFVIYNFISLVVPIAFLLAFFVSIFIPLPRPFHSSHSQDSLIIHAVILSLTVLQWHFSAVCYSLYKNVKGEKNNFKATTIYSVTENKV